MTRAIVTPPVLAPAALAELKAWLGLATTRDDAELTALLQAGLDLCAAFTGSLPLTVPCEEQFAPAACWHVLSARPVQAITAVEAVGLTGTRVVLPPGDYAIDLGPDGEGRVRLLRSDRLQRIAVRYTAGLAAEWDLLPMALRQGLIRLAAHEHRQRDGDPAATALPAAVAALWRPYRRMRLA